MKLNKLPILLLLVSSALVLASCRKCIECRNICYDCGPNTNVICSDAATTQAQFNALIQAIESTGKTCTLTSSTKIQRFCDKKSTLDNIKRAYEDDLYECASQ